MDKNATVMVTSGENIVTLSTELIKKLAVQIKKDEKNDYLLHSYTDSKGGHHYEHINKSEIASYHYLIDTKNPDNFYRVFKGKPVSCDDVVRVPCLENGDVICNGKPIKSKYALVDVPATFYEELKVE